ncbi:diguanylate cyclase [Duganella sp. Leaf126]|uniref:GGDEF domain-containing protein n=1 Tax=Duganella sp. Leaf126 TaxID=1736266 RepID=UPI0006F84F1A|nr:GGDEF domain-containing protein [Duganella sp. Leaf126]KQQ45795.1 diguanylate cyclase [Duganella sp. Leaf126]
MDIKTLVLALALGNLSLCVALFFFGLPDSAGSGHGNTSGNKSHGLSTTLRGNATWARARQLQALAWGLVYLRGTLPDFLTIPLANALLLAGFALDAAALWEQAGRRIWRRHLLPVLLAAVAAFVAAWLLQRAPSERQAISSLAIGFFLAAGAGALGRRWSAGTLLRRYLVVSTVVLALLVVARGVLVLLLPNGWSWVSPELVQGLGLVALYLAMLGNGGGYLLLVRQGLHDALERLEVIDPLTSALNRRGFHQALAPWLALARRPGQPTALVMVDLDEFKRVNDHYGHLAGDQVLVAMADACKRQLRDSDTLGHLGGGEFAILLPRTALPEAMVVAERVRGALAAQPVKAEKALINLTASLGATTMRADDTTVGLFQRADHARQQARAAGGNRVATSDSAAAATPPGG